MQTLNIENFNVFIHNQGDDTHLQWIKGEFLFENQNSNTIAYYVNVNFKIVKEHYSLLADGFVTEEDINFISLIITLHYLYIYNMWRNTYIREKNRSLLFDKKDFNDSGTHDLIFYYLKPKYPDSWEVKSAALLNMDLDKLKEYYKERVKFYNK